MNTPESTLSAFETESVLARASEETGLDDFGDERFIEGLATYTQALMGEARLNDAGIIGAQAVIQRQLVNRLRFQRDLKLHPEISEERISAPIIILGLPRTGTTKLQRMISSDPEVQRLELWRLLNPAPLPSSEAAGPDPRIAVAQGYEQLITTQFPEFMAAHPTRAREPDEESVLMEMSFEFWASGVRAHIPSFESWATARSADTIYSYLRLTPAVPAVAGWRRPRPTVGAQVALAPWVPEDVVGYFSRCPRSALLPRSL